MTYSVYDKSAEHHKGLGSQMRAEAFSLLRQSFFWLITANAVCIGFTVSTVVSQLDLTIVCFRYALTVWTCGVASGVIANWCLFSLVMRVANEAHSQASIDLARHSLTVNVSGALASSQQRIDEHVKRGLFDRASRDFDATKEFVADSTSSLKNLDDVAKPLLNYDIPKWRLLVTDAFLLVAIGCLVGGCIIAYRELATGSL
ncbi:MAG: hypothetical protein HRU11_05535 [Parvularculaceae bacterium]|nr:hypothetical protein [Parvularculaceae bacterium]